MNKLYNNIIGFKKDYPAIRKNIFTNYIRQNIETSYYYKKKHSNLYKLMINRINYIRRLSSIEETNLGFMSFYNADTLAAKTLVFYNIKLAIKIATQYKRNWTDFMDLVQEASVGIIIASKKWNPSKGTRFGTYASYWIKSQLSKFLILNARLIHTGNTRSGRKIYFNLPNIYKQLSVSGVRPSSSLISKKINENDKEVSLVLTILENFETRLSYPYKISDSVKDIQLSPEDSILNDQIQEQIHNSIHNFYFLISDNRDKYIWRKYIVSEKPISLVDIGKNLKVSKQRIGQLVERLKIFFKQYMIRKIGYKYSDFM